MPGRDGVLLAWAEEARVEAARGVEILKVGEHRFTDLEPRMHLRSGDLLAVPPGSRLRIETEEGEIRTPRSGLDARDPRGTRLILVTGESALRTAPRPRRRQRPTALPRAAIERTQKQGWLRFGEAGRRLRPEDWRGYQGPEERPNDQP